VYNCWDVEPHIVAWMKQHQFTNKGALQYYINRLETIVQDYDNNNKNNMKVPIHWEEIFDDGLTVIFANQTIFQVWENMNSLVSIVNTGYRGILSNYNAWYLDCGIEGNWCPYCTWTDMFLNEPYSVKGLTEQGKKRILGGEVCMWGELVDRDNIIQVVWPRTASVAERLWSQESQLNSVPDHFVRLLKQRCRMVTRGIKVSPLIPGSDAEYCINIQE